MCFQLQTLCNLLVCATQWSGCWRCGCSRVVFVPAIAAAVVWLKCVSWPRVNRTVNMALCRYQNALDVHILQWLKIVFPVSWLSLALEHASDFCLGLISFSAPPPHTWLCHIDACNKIVCYTQTIVCEHHTDIWTHSNRRRWFLS